ncbi:MAG TPA: hypothetical protein VM409_04505 [Chloroflexia bacterium]|nr:hypothetical protein [Chloroflexia bacterium]
MEIWLFLLAIIVLEVAGIGWWLRREFLPPFFNGWAALIYCGILSADLVLAWLVSLVFSAPGTDMSGFPVCGLLIFIIAAFFTFFFRWVVRQDMSGPTPPDRT